MGGKNKDKQQTQTVSNLPPAYIQSAQKDALSQITPLFQNGAGPTSPDTIYSPLSGMQQQGIEGVQGAVQQLTPQAIGQVSDTLGGKYLNANPYLDQLVGLVSDDAMAGVNATFGGAGRTGGGLHQQALATGLADASAAIRAPAYEAERARMMQAVPLAGQAINPLQQQIATGSILQQDAYNKSLADLAMENTPYSRVGEYADLINRVAAGAGTNQTQTQTQPGRSTAAGIAGGAMSGSTFGPWGAVIGGTLGGLGII